MAAQQILNEIEALAETSSNNCLKYGETLISSFEASSKPLLLWINFLEESETTFTANCLLAGIRSASNEAASCLALGLVRPSLNSMRLQVDLLLAWIYFKDHPVEWQKISDTGDGYKLKTEIFRYLSDHYTKFSERFGILTQCATRGVADPYRLLSAHIHGQSEYVLPAVSKPSDIVDTHEKQLEVIRLQADCSEYLSDILWSIYADKWASVAEDLTKTLMPRFKTTTQKATFFVS